MPKTSRPIYMPELAELLWPGAYNFDDKEQRHNACRRARRFLRRLEHQRDKPPLLYKDGDGRRVYTTLQLLKRHARELTDLRELVERLVAERDGRLRNRVVAQTKAQAALGARQRHLRQYLGGEMKKLDRRVKVLEDRVLGQTTPAR
jgi:hypothetical protein